MRRSLITLALVALVALGAGQTLGAGSAATASVTLDAPSRVDGHTSVALELTVPPSVAAIDGRLLFDEAAAEVVGLAPTGTGTALGPQPIATGVAFGAYGLSASKDRTRLRLVVAPHAPGRVDFTVVIDAVADAAGNRLNLGSLTTSRRLIVGSGGVHHRAPLDRGMPRALRPAGQVRDLVADGVLGAMDLDTVRAGWDSSRVTGATCGDGRDAAADANGDGCVDIVDVQLVAAALGTGTGSAIYPTGDAQVGAAPNANATFTVNSALDTPDANSGDGRCADANGRCTLRAAITQANWQAGDNRIEFNLAGQAPVLIQLGSTPMSIVQDRSGGLVIDGYSQPGARVNNAVVGSNAVPGVMIRGTGDLPRGVALRITSAGNTVRGILFSNIWRSIVVDGPDAADNRIVGNLFGYLASGAITKYRNGFSAVLLNGGAHGNVIGTPARADRNVAGNGRKGFYLHGPGTDHNLMQNNVLCLTPSGMAPTPCQTAIDMNFGPKSNVVGGAGDGERNVIGPTRLNGIEISHGWDPEGGADSERWELRENRVIGNWIGFRGDGAYHENFRSGRRLTENDSNGVNVIDGSHENVVEGNTIAAAWDGINVMNANTSRNVVRGNTIGVSPRGEAAPVGRHGIQLRRGTHHNVVENNVIRNFAARGISLSDAAVDANRLSRNLMSNSNGVAIFLAPGANGGIAPVAITAATTAVVRGTAVKGATIEVYRASRPAGQSGLPLAFLGTGVAGLNGAWSVAIAVGRGDLVTALQIDGDGDTSALAQNVAAAADDGQPGPIAAFDWDQRAGSRTVDFTDKSTGTPTAWSWDFGDGFGSDARHPSHEYAQPGTYQVELTVTNARGTNTVARQIEVLASTTVIAADRFARTVSSAWGSADVGGAYAVGTVASDFGVAGGVGTIVLPGAGLTRSALLGVAERDVDIRLRVAADKVAAGSHITIYAICRRIGSSEYRPRLVFSANGTVSVAASIVVNGTESALGTPVVVAGLTQASAAFVWLRTQVSGINPTTIKVKAWADGQAEPNSWQFTATNTEGSLQATGTIGVRVYSGSGLTNVPVTLSIDDLQVQRF